MYRRESLRLLHSLNLLSLHHFYLSAFLSTLQFPWCRGLKPRALPLRSRVPRTLRTPPQVMSPTTTSSRRVMSSTHRSPWLGNGSLKISTPTTSVRRSSMRAEEESITLKEKACRLVCRRQWVMIKRCHPLFAVTQVTRKVPKFREKTLNANRLGLILDWQSE